MKIGDRVHYIPFEGVDSSKIENGIIKSILDTEYCFVVYNCGGEWKNYMNYTAARTKTSQLRKGWFILNDTIITN